jgi:hypothetical protein
LTKFLVENKIVQGRSSLKPGYVKLQVKRFSVHDEEVVAVGKATTNKSAAVVQQQQQQPKVSIQRRKSEPAKNKSFNATTNSADNCSNIKHYRQFFVFKPQYANFGFSVCVIFANFFLQSVKFIS